MDFTEPDLLLTPAFSTAESVQTGKSVFALGGLVAFRTRASGMGCKFCFPVGVPGQAGRGTGTAAHADPGPRTEVGRVGLSRQEPVWVHSACVSTLLRPN